LKRHAAIANLPPFPVADAKQLSHSLGSIKKKGIEVSPGNVDAYASIFKSRHVSQWVGVAPTNAIAITRDWVVRSNGSATEGIEEEGED
jgi:hypothetical protein